MTPAINLHLTVWACSAVAFFGGLLAAWGVAPHKVWARNLRFSLLLPVIGVGLLTSWWAFLRFPQAVMATIMAFQGASIPDLRYWVMLLPAMVFDVALTLTCLYEATAEAWDLWTHDPNGSQLG